MTVHLVHDAKLLSQSPQGALRLLTSTQPTDSNTTSKQNQRKVKIKVSKKLKVKKNKKTIDKYLDKSNSKSNSNSESKDIRKFRGIRNIGHFTTFCVTSFASIMRYFFRHGFICTSAVHIRNSEFFF